MGYYECRNDCGRCYSKQDQLIVHLEYFKSNIQCCKCSRRFKSEKTLKSHIRKESGCTYEGEMKRQRVKKMITQ